MPNQSRLRVFRTLVRTALAMSAVAAAGESGAADALLPIVDTHVHYSRDAWTSYPPAAVLKLFDQAGVRRAFVSSTPDDGTLRLFDQDHRRIVPILRPYRDGTAPSSLTSSSRLSRGET